MENKVLKKLGEGRSTQDAYAEIRQGNSERWTIQSQKRKYVNGKLSVKLVILLAVILLYSPVGLTPLKKYPLDLNFYWVDPTEFELIFIG